MKKMKLKKITINNLEEFLNSLVSQSQNAEISDVGGLGASSNIDDCHNKDSLVKDILPKTVKTYFHIYFLLDGLQCLVIAEKDKDAFESFNQDLYDKVKRWYITEAYNEKKALEAS